MKQKMVVTNLRIPESDWLRVKATASELGMSFNEYINFIAIKSATLPDIPSGLKKGKRISIRKLSIWDLPNAVKDIHQKPMGLSQEDEEIYGI